MNLAELKEAYKARKLALDSAKKEEEKYKAHDELIMEVPEDHIKEGADLLVNTMKRVGHSLIDLPMSVDAEVNDYWYGENLADDYLEEE